MAENFIFQQLIDSLIERESRGDPSATSEKGAVGLMQIMPQHAHDLYGSNAPSVFDEARRRGYDVPNESVDTARGLLMDPEINYALGDPYLRDLMRAFGGNIENALTAYNAGPDAMKNMLAAGKAPDDFASQEAREYFDKVNEIYRQSTGQDLPETMDLRQLVRPRARPAGLLSGGV
jgi:soluble lytic murein transglycosylase-like protein